MTPQLGKSKKSSFIISLVDLVLAAASCLLFFTYKADGDFGTSFTQMQTFFTSSDWSQLTNIAIALLTAGPVLFAIVGLFSKASRVAAILCFAAFLCSLSGYVGFTAGAGLAFKDLFNFSTNALAMLSSGFIVNILGTVLSLVNLAKAK